MEKYPVGSSNSGNLFGKNYPYDTHLVHHRPGLCLLRNPFMASKFEQGIKILSPQQAWWGGLKGKMERQLNDDNLHTLGVMLSKATEAIMMSITITVFFSFFT